MKLKCNQFQVDLSAPKIMGILNVTPDSFSDGGKHNTFEQALACAKKLIDEGADFLDIGGESTRPNAPFVSEDEEWARVAPVLEAVRKLGIPVSLDTRRTGIMKKALEKGWVDLINDVSALEDDGAIELLAQYPDVAICLMHKKGNPENMQQQPFYEDVVKEVTQYLQTRVDACTRAGIEKQRITVDPGFGFGKTLEHNITLMNTLQDWAQELDLPVLIGVSRKNMIGQITGENTPSERVSGSVAAALAACARGAKIIRVHDVKPTADALAIWQTMGVYCVKPEVLTK